MCKKITFVLWLFTTLQAVSQVDSIDHGQIISTTPRIGSQVEKAKDSRNIRKEVEEEARPVYVETFKTVYEIKTYVEMARKGKMSKSKAIAMYNNKLGPEMGELSSLSKIKERLDTAGDAYIKYKFLQACAEIALRKAAEASFKAEMLRRNQN